jgi:hypothetical protein
MDSKQLNFYSHPQEITTFLDFLLSKNVNISVEPFRTEPFELYQNADFIKSNELFFRIILFKNDELSQNIITEFIDTQNYFLFENSESNIIQFDFPRIRENNTLYRGRFYFKTGYWKGDYFVKKDPEFIKWAANILNGFKKKFLTSKEPFLGYYCTDFVKKLVDNNEVILKQI